MEKESAKTVLNKSIQDVSWKDFLNKSSFKAEEAGKMIKKIDPRNTSKTCSCCGYIQDMPLNIRIYRCPQCGMEMDRDLNASKNIERLGLQSLDVSRREAS